MITALYASILAIMFLVISYRLVFLRYRLYIPIGDGGHDEMKKLLQVRGNMIDYVPLILLMMYILENFGMPDELLHLLGISVVVSRLLQGWGLSMSTGASIGRISGGILMHLALICAAFLCLWNFMLFKGAF